MPDIIGFGRAEIKPKSVAATPLSYACGVMSKTTSDTAQLLEQVRAQTEKVGVFGPIQPKGAMLVCAAQNSAAPAEYRLFKEGDVWWVSLVTADRWLSESIESDLLHTGDKMEELVEEELAELGCDHKVTKIEHFRSDAPAKLYTFRTKVPAHADQSALAATYLLAMEAAFRNLGDINAGTDEDA